MIRKYAEIFCWKNVSSFCSAKATHIFSAKNIRILYIESAKTVNEMTLNKLVKLTTLWTTGPCTFCLKICLIWSFGTYFALWSESNDVCFPDNEVSYSRPLVFILCLSFLHLFFKDFWRSFSDTILGCVLLSGAFIICLRLKFSCNTETVAFTTFSQKIRPAVFISTVPDMMGYSHNIFLFFDQNSINLTKNSNIKYLHPWP